MVPHPLSYRSIPSPHLPVTLSHYHILLVQGTYQSPKLHSGLWFCCLPEGMDFGSCSLLSLEWCLAHRRWSINICGLNAELSVSVTYAWEVSNALEVLQLESGEARIQSKGYFSSNPDIWHQKKLFPTFDGSYSTTSSVTSFQGI